MQRQTPRPSTRHCGSLPRQDRAILADHQATRCHRTQTEGVRTKATSLRKVLVVPQLRGQQASRGNASRVSGRRPSPVLLTWPQLDRKQAQHSSTHQVALGPRPLASRAVTPASQREARSPTHRSQLGREEALPPGDQTEEPPLQGVGPSGA